MTAAKIPIAALSYNDVKFKWISGHWDFHREGWCTYNGQSCEFKTIEKGWDDEEDEPILMCEIYELSLKEKWKWWWRQKMFELCVGYHWTYPHRKNGHRFYIRKPQWFFNWLFNVYYHKHNRKKSLNESN